VSIALGVFGFLGLMTMFFHPERRRPSPSTIDLWWDCREKQGIGFTLSFAILVLPFIIGVMISGGVYAAR